MKVLFIHYAIIDKEGFGRTYKFAKELAILGHEVVLITTQPSNAFSFPFKVEYRNKVKIISFPDILPNNFRRTGFAVFSAILKLIYLIKRHHFDIVHSDTGHRPSAAIPAFFLQFFYRIPHVMEWWDYFGRGGQFEEKSFLKKITHGYYDLIMQKRLMKLTTGLIVLSNFLKQKAIDYNINEDRLIVLHGGAEIDEIKYYPSNYEQKEAKNIPANSLTFGFIGMNKSEFKDLLPFIKAIKILKGELDVNWFTTGEMISEKLKKKYKIHSESKEFGWQDYNTYAESIGCADIFLLVQRENLMNEARWPNKIGDYLAAGRLILTNPVGEIKVMAKEFPDAFIETDYNAEALIETIKKIYQDKTNLLQKGAHVRKIAENHMSWKLKAAELLNFYNTVISGELKK